MPDIVFRVDRGFRHLFIGGALHRISELQPERFIGKTGRELGFPPDLCDRFEATCREVLESGESRSFEALVRGVWVLHRLYPERNGDGEVRSILGIAEDITDRKRADAAVLESEQRLKQFVRHQPAPVAMFDRDMRYLEASERWLIQHNVDPGMPFRGRCHYDVFPDLPPHWREVHQRGMRGEVIRSEGELWRRADNTSLWVRWEVRPWETLAGEVGGILIFSEDVTASKEAKRTLARTTNLLESLLAAAPLGMCYLDRDLRFIRVNEHLAAMNGIPAADHIGKTVHELLPDLLPTALEVTTRVLATGRAVVGHDFIGSTRLQPSVKRHWSEGWYPIHDGNGAVSGFGVIVEEITHRKRLEKLERTVKTKLQVQVAAQTKVLRDQAARLAAILETAADSIITIDGRGIIQSVNPAAVRAFGYTAAEMVGKNVTLLMPEPYKDEHNSYLSRYLKTGERRIIGIGREAQARRKDGSVFPIDLAVSEVVKGQLFTGIIRDTTERVVAAQRLRESERMSSLGVLAAGLAHDINNMLLPLRAHLSVAQASAGSTRAHKSIHDASAIAESIQQMADGLHYLAADGGEDDAKASTDLHDWWKQVGPMLSRAVPRHVVVTASLPKRLPRVSISQHRLTQAVLNLIVNAGQAIPSPVSAEEAPNARAKASQARRGVSKRRPRTALGIVSVKATAATPRRGKGRAEGRGTVASAVRLTVRDNGTGMTDDVKRRAFDLFFTTKPRGLGSGLGLPLVARVMHGAGGSVEIDSTPGKGTSVTLMLPVMLQPRMAGRGVAVERRGVTAAAITMTERRGAALIRQLLHDADIATPAGLGPEDAVLWVVDPAMVPLSTAAAWRAKRAAPRRTRTLVVLGPLPRAEASAWKDLASVVIERRDDYSSIRDGIARALRNMPGSSRTSR